MRFSMLALVVVVVGLGCAAPSAFVPLYENVLIAAASGPRASVSAELAEAGVSSREALSITQYLEHRESENCLWMVVKREDFDDRLFMCCEVDLKPYCYEASWKSTPALSWDD